MRPTIPNRSISLDPFERLQQRTFKLFNVPATYGSASDYEFMFPENGPIAMYYDGETVTTHRTLFEIITMFSEKVNFSIADKDDIPEMYHVLEEFILQYPLEKFADHREAHVFYQKIEKFRPFIRKLHTAYVNQIKLPKDKQRSPKQSASNFNSVIRSRIRN
jgi:hypothetical protein